MKFSVSDLKNLNYKQLLIDHVEKFIFAIILLCVINFLFGTRWKPYDRTPQELIDQVTEKEEQFKISTWPDEAKEKFNNSSNIIEEVKSVFEPLSVSEFASKEGLFEPLIKPNRPYEEPELLPLEKIIASVGRSPIYAVNPNKPKTDPNKEKAIADKKNEPDNDNPFAPRNQNGGPGKGKKRVKKGKALKFKIGINGGNGFKRENESIGTTSPKKIRTKRKRKDFFARGHHYIVVRGIIPFKKQLNKIAEARGEIATDEMNHDIYYESVVQRQETLPGSTDWPTEWETLENPSYKKIYVESKGEYDEIVDEKYSHPYLTMPLAARAAGYWGKEISHPALKQARLSPLELRIVEALDEMKSDGSIGQEEDEENNESLPDKEWDIEGQTSSRKLLDEISNNSNKIDELIEKIKEEDEFKNTPVDKIKEMVQEKANSEGSFLLYRFFDFDILPDRQYRYRVQLILKNPNYGYASAMLARPDVGDGLTRVTEWSKITKPVTVEPDSSYSLAEISPARGSSSPTADFEYYQWLDSSGTIIYKELSIQPGQFLGGKITTRVLRPGPETYKEEEIDLDNYDVVVDLMPAPAFNRNDFPELKNSSTDRRKQKGLSSEALIANEFGALVSLNPGSLSETATKTKKEYRQQQRAYRDTIKYYEDDENFTDEEEDDDDKKKKKKKNNKKKKK